MKKEEKLGRIDLKATINESKIINIEIQLKDRYNMQKRSEFYGARLITDQFGKGDQYQELKPVILINILNYNLLDVPDYCTKTVTVADKHRDYEVIKDITYWFIELPKFRMSKPKLANLLECWLALIDGENRGLIEMAKEKDEIIKEAEEDVEEILSEADLKALQEYRLTAIWERNSIIGEAKRRAEEEADKKIQEAETKVQEAETKVQEAEMKVRKFEKEAQEISKKANEEKEKINEEKDKINKEKEIIEEKFIETVKALLKTNMSISQICDITKLTEEEIKRIKRS